MKTDLISRQAAKQALGDAHFQNYGYAIMVIADVPSVDAVEVVRCKDCKHWKPEPMGDVMMCYSGMCGRWTTPDDFCSYGRRKDAGRRWMRM